MGSSFSNNVSEIPQILEGPKTMGQTCKIESLLLMEEIRLTSWFGETAIILEYIYKVSYMSGGAGSLPSTVCWPIVLWTDPLLKYNNLTPINRSLVDHATSWKVTPSNPKSSSLVLAQTRKKSALVSWFLLSWRECSLLFHDLRPQGSWSWTSNWCCDVKWLMSCRIASNKWYKTHS